MDTPTEALGLGRALFIEPEIVEDVDADGGSAPPQEVRIAWLVSAVFFVALPAAILVALLSDQIVNRTVGYDFRVDLDAAKALLRTGTPYAAVNDFALTTGKQYVYPPLTALVLVPVTVLPSAAAGFLMMVALAAAVLTIPLVLGVRDLRCLGLVLLWPPVIQGIQTSNVAIPLVLAGALVWRLRDRAIPAGLALGTAFAVKFALVPVAIWLAATRRYAAAVWATVFAVSLLLGSWAAIGFDGFTAYPNLVRRLTAAMDDQAYSLYAVILDLGASSAVARVVWLGVGIALLTWAVGTGRRGDERRSFMLAIAATIALSPVVWLESFVALIVVIAVAVPRLAPIWFIPLAMWVTGGSHDPSEFKTVGTFTVAALTIAVALRSLPKSADDTEGRGIVPPPPLQLPLLDPHVARDSRFARLAVISAKCRSRSEPSTRYRSS